MPVKTWPRRARRPRTAPTVLLDDNNRKPIARLHFNAGQKYLGLFDAEKNETRHPIVVLADIYAHAAVIRETVHYYD